MFSAEESKFISLKNIRTDDAEPDRHLFNPL